MSGRFSRLSPALVPGAVIALTVSTVSLGADIPRSRADADQMLRKIALITTNGLMSRPAARRTTVTEREINAFLTFHARSEMPPGIIDPVVTIAESGRLVGKAIVDLDQVKRAQRGDSVGVLALVSGRVPVEATGVLRASKGVGKFDLETATIGGMPVPEALLQQVISHYSRTPDNPAGIDLEAPFDLPVGIREITTEKGQAIVVQ